MKKLLILLFFVRVLIPTQVQKYDNVVSFVAGTDGTTVLVLRNGKKVIVPTMWTVIEEK
jgi:hypothetical protein